MDQNLFEKGLARRKATLGADYVENNLAAAVAVTRPLQEAMTAWCWASAGVTRQLIPRPAR
jgi:4-carboxymuconolactone decarboxylase